MDDVLPLVNSHRADVAELWVCDRYPFTVARVAGRALVPFFWRSVAVGDMLEALADTHVDHQVIDPYAEPRTADQRVAAVVCHLRQTCRPTQCAVELL